MARLDLKFETFPYEVLDDNAPGLLGAAGEPDEATLLRYVSFQDRPSGDILSVAGSIFKWVGTSTAVPQNIGKLRIKHDFSVTHHLVPKEAIGTKLLNQGRLAEYRIDDALGKVNSVAFRGYDPGEVLLVGCEIRPYRDPFGVRIYDVTYAFSVDRTNHQFIYGVPSTTAGFFEITVDGATNLVNQTADKSIYNFYNMLDLFRPARALF
jgi:hypothetical protein